MHATESDAFSHRIRLSRWSTPCHYRPDETSNPAATRALCWTLRHQPFTGRVPVGKIPATVASSRLVECAFVLPSSFPKPCWQH
ncbi:hypothetical protein HBI47_116730 [Parastagonospora nodorum]|nr:hypothetical protein HBI47_116730 [Parastagonospora nodorum]